MALLTVGVGARDIELVTVTDTSFTVSWFTKKPLRSGVSYGSDPAVPDGRAVDDQPRRCHYLTVDGLSPGTAYYYRVETRGTARPPRALPPFSVTTLPPPPGEKIMTFAVINDLHAMEDIAGVMMLPLKWAPLLTPGFTWKFPPDNYWEFTLRATVDAINQSDASLCVVNGDLTSWFSLEEFEAVRSYLDRLDCPYYVSRGNHDRVEDNPRDYFLDTFGLASSWYSFDREGFHFIILDDNRLDNGWHGFPEEEFAWLEQDLVRSRQSPTFVFCHRPLATGGVDQIPEIRDRLLSILAANPQVAAVFNAHSHAARVATIPERTGSMPYIEVPSVKEYPVGYGMVEVYEGGMAYNFHLADCPDCREWNHVTRDEYFGFAPRLLMNGLEDRNFVYVFPPEVRKAVIESRAGGDRDALAGAGGGQGRGLR